MNIGYLVPEFPGQTHGFFWREILQIEGAGHKVRIFSTRRPKGSVAHAFSEAASKRTYYLAEFRIRDTFKWVYATFAALSIIRRADVQKLYRTNESFKRIFLLSIIGANLASILRREGIDHIHGHSCSDSGYVLAFSRLAGGPPFSLSLHGDLAVYGCGHDFKFGHAKFVACVTDALIKQVQEQVTGLAQEPKLIRMGIEREPAHQKNGDWSPPGTLNIVTVARLNPAKGHKYAISVVGELRKRGMFINYDIIGDGDYSYEIKNEIKKHHLEDCITMVGPISNDQIGKRLANYDAFVLPSIGLGEAAPVAVMEAMSIGLPVVCSIIGGTPEMIQHGLTGFLFAQGDETALYDILADLAQHPELRKRVGSAGQAHAHANFLTSVSAAALIDCIRA